MRKVQVADMGPGRKNPVGPSADPQTGKDVTIIRGLTKDKSSSLVSQRTWSAAPSPLKFSGKPAHYGDRGEECFMVRNDDPQSEHIMEIISKICSFLNGIGDQFQSNPIPLKFSGDAAHY